MLEAMAERQVSMGGRRYQLPELFMVMATQNPIEHEGTYNLPEAQLDRFLMYIKIDQPDARIGEEKFCIWYAARKAPAAKIFPAGRTKTKSFRHWTLPIFWPRGRKF